MSDIFDVRGASGAVYRFRLAASDTLPATAGNLLIVRTRRGAPHVLACVAAASLAHARQAAADSLKANRGAACYVRLNVARAVREAEHADIVQALAPEQVLELA